MTSTFISAELHPFIKCGISTRIKQITDCSHAKTVTRKLILSLEAFCVAGKNFSMIYENRNWKIKVSWWCQLSELTKAVEAVEDVSLIALWWGRGREFSWARWWAWAWRFSVLVWKKEYLVFWNSYHFELLTHSQGHIICRNFSMLLPLCV